MSPIKKNFGFNKGRKFGMKPTLYRVSGEGPMPADIMLIGERPGEQEAAKGRPFVGASGSILNRCLDNAGLDRSKIYITNLVKEYKDYEKPTPEDIARDEAEIVSEIVCVQPKVIGTLGTYATEWLLCRDRAMLDKSHGVPLWLGAGHKVQLPNQCIVVPCYHPAAGLYSSDNLALTGADLVAVSMALDGSLSPPEDIFGECDYRVSYNPDGVIDTTCAIDTEGSRRSPWCLTFSVQSGTAWLIHPGHLPRFSGRVFLHNSLHDLSVLRTMGVRIEDDQFRDTMVWAYLLGLEPQGLKALAYRHAGMEMMSYEEVIHEADYVKAMEYLLTIEAYGDEWPKTEPYTIIEGGVAKVRKPHSIQQRVGRILSDVARKPETDPRLRWNNIDDYVKQPIIDAIGDMPEATLDDVPYDIALKYACRDADATYRIAPILESKIAEMGLGQVSDIDHSIIPMIDRMQEVGIRLSPKEAWDELEAECDQIMGVSRFGIFNLTGCSINPDSGDQVADLLYNTLKVPVPWLTKGGKNKEARGSTIDKALESITEQRDVVDLVLDYREASKVKSSFVGPLRRVLLSGDDRVHCTFRITRVVTGRLAATNPNMLAIPVRSDLGKKIRTRFIAAEGRILGEWDLDQVEMRYMADVSQDEKLCAIFREGKVDIHTQTAAWTFGVPYGNVVTEQRYAAKRVGFGVITGITEHGLLDQMNLARARRPDGERWTLDDCAQMIDGWFDIYGGVKRFIKNAGDECEATGMARDRWGRIRYLPAVWSPIKYVQEEARRQASSFKIQAGAQGLMKRAMAEIWKMICKLGLADPLLQVHDSLMLEVPDEKETKQYVDEMTVHCLTKTTQLSVPVKAKGGYGYNWAECK